VASSGKKKTTFAKLARESKLRERRLDKQARKDARKLAAEAGTPAYGDAGEAEGLDGGPDAEVTDAASDEPAPVDAR
jgi:hypothetical protein